MTEETLFHLALEKPAPERPAFLDGACAGDAELRRRVQMLLKAHDDPGSFLRKPALESTGTNPAEPTRAFEAAARPADGDQTHTEPQHPAGDDLAFLTPSQRPGSLGRLEHYEILQVVGKGGFGTVLKAFDDSLHRVVAIKVLSPELSASGTARQRFIREARTAAAVTHDHVVTIHAVVADHRPPYLVMQMIDGVTLQQKLDQTGILSLREILRIGLQMAEGLAAAHKHGLVHRDIKPANILLENGIERVKITDFGLARAVDDASVTQSGTVAGTPMYMSPEQAEGLPIDHRSDLFSLGTVLYAMCTGHPPFRASGTHAVLKRVIDASPRPIREINNEVPDWLCDIIARLHAQKPEDRFQTAKEVAELLGQRLADVQAGRAIERRVDDRRAEPRKGPGEAPANETATRPLTGLGSPRKRATLAAIAIVALVAVGITISELTHLTHFFHASAPAGVAGEWGSNFGWVTIEHPPIEGDQPVAVTGFYVQGANKAAITKGSFDPETGRLQFEYSEPWLGLTGSADLQLSTNRTRLDGTWINSADGSGTWNMVRKDLVPQPDLASKSNESGWVQLFNGRNLDGWRVQPTSWKVEDGNLKGTGELIHEREFENFHLRLEGMIESQPNLFGNLFATGVFVRGKANDGGVATVYRAAIQHDKKGFTASLWRHQDGADHLLQPDEEYRVPTHKWFVLEVIAAGKKLTVKVDNVVVADTIDTTHVRGQIVLFANDKVRYKTIEIKPLPAPSAVGLDGWVQLFNGKQTHGLILGAWQIDKKSKLLLGSGPGQTYVFTERDDYADFHLKAEAMCGVNTDSAIFFRCGKELLKGDFPAGYQVYTGTRRGNLNPYALLLTTADSAKPMLLVNPTYRAPPGGDYQPLEIIARGKRIVVKFDGKTLVDYTDDKAAHRKGRIALHVSSPDAGGIAFKKIEIKELPPEETLGYALSFDGIDDHVAIANLKYTGSHPITLEAWVRVPKVPERNMTIVGNSGALTIGLNEKGQWNASVRDMPGMLAPAHRYVWSDELCKPLRWTHVALVLSGRTGNLYVDGRLQKSRAKLRADHIPSPEPFLVGGRRPPKSVHDYPLHGDVSTVRVSKVARYNGDFTPDKTFKTDSDTLALYDFKQGYSELLHDSSGLERHGQVVGAKWINIDDNRPPVGEWASYFNGQDLRGWRLLSPGKGDWQVRDGLLVGHSTEGGKYLFSNRLDWGSFHLKMEAKLKGAGEILYHIHHNDWKGGIEVIHHGKPDSLRGAIRSPVDRNWHPSIKEVTFPKDDWFVLEVIADGPRLVTKANGVVTADVTLSPEQQKKWYKEGVISIGCGSKGEWTIRKIEIKQLPLEEPGWVQLFNGKDLPAWIPAADNAWKMEGELLVGRGPAVPSAPSALVSKRTDYRDFHLRAEIEIDAVAAVDSQPGLMFYPRWQNGVGYGFAFHPRIKKFGHHGFGMQAPLSDIIVELQRPLSQKVWHKLEMIAKGPNVSLTVDGQLLCRAKGEMRQGAIAFHAANKVVTRMRNIEIKELPPEASPAPAVAPFDAK